MSVDAQANLDESKVGAYELPDPLTDAAGRRVETAAAWRERRRELLDLFATHVYGRTPTAPVRAQATVRSADKSGTATRTQVSLALEGPKGRATLELLLDLPNAATGPVPVFLGLNFRGNHTVDADPAIAITERWTMDDLAQGFTDHRATEASRGTAASRWAIGHLIEHGYGSATVYCGDLFPDHADGRPESVAALFEDESWGAIGCWAWGLSRAADYLASLPQVDAQRLVVHGHSRLGKAALWAAAQDERFAMAVSNESGCGGASLARRNFGETVALINDRFPHWFNSTYKGYNNAESTMPVDQHMLLALVAPRPLAVASAADDLWSDPKGEFLSAVNATPVYRMLGVEGLAVKEMPPVGEPVSSRLGYHIRAGAHDITLEDWAQYVRLADRYLG